MQANDRESVEFGVQAHFVALFAETLRARGLDVAGLLARAGIDPAVFRTPEARVPVTRFDRLWDLALAATGDMTIALDHARRFQPGTYHVLGFALYSSATLEDAAERTLRFIRVLSDEPHIVCGMEGGEFRIAVLPGRSPIRSLSIVANVLQVCRTLAGAELRPRHVEVAGLPEPAAATADAVRAWFGCPLRFDAPLTRIAFDAGEATRPLPAANAELARRGQEVIETYLAELDRHSAVPAVAAQVLKQLSSGRFNKAQVARGLGMSTTTLQRRLAAEGLTFRQVVEDTRRDLAERYVRKGRHPMKEIAFLLGYSDLSNFTRAFRGWFGVPPSTYQQQAATALDDTPGDARP